MNLMGIVERLRKMVDATQWEYVWQVERQQRLDIRQAADLIERMGEVLREAEWCCVNIRRETLCPACQMLESAGHAPDCELAAILRELE